MRKSAYERMMEKVHFVPECGCWLFGGAWIGRDLQYGAVLSDEPGKNTYAHRLSWEHHFGPIPEGMLVCHKCDTPACCNPDHLFLGTHQDNMDDRKKKGRNNGRFTEFARKRRWSGGMDVVLSC